MELSRNLTFSLFLHAALLSFAVTFISGRDAIKRIPPSQVEVMLMTETTPSSQLKPITRKSVSMPSIKTEAVSAPPIAAATLSNQIRPKVVPASAGATKKDVIISPDNKKGESDSGRSQGFSFIDDSRRSGGPPVASIAGHSEIQSSVRSVPGTVEGSGKGHTDEMAAIRAAIERAKKYPLAAKRRGIEGTATVEFSIDTKGMPENIKIVTSSGSDILDNAALSTITRAVPFPRDIRIIKVPIAFRLEKED